MCIPVLEFDTQVIDGLKSELPKYVAASENLFKQIDCIQWWSSHEIDLPNWAKACRLIILVQPSSAASERVFLTIFLFNKNDPLKTIVSCKLFYNTIIVKLWDCLTVQVIF